MISHTIKYIYVYVIENLISIYNFECLRKKKKRNIRIRYINFVIVLIQLANASLSVLNGGPAGMFILGGAFPFVGASVGILCVRNV